MKLLKLKLIILIISCLGIFLSSISIANLASNRNLITNSCTIFTVSQNDEVFFANNEDYPLKHGRIWFFPSLTGKYGVALFGYKLHNNVDIYVGGINDQGLCIDMNALRTQVSNPQPERQDYMGAPIQQMLEECSTIMDVLNWINDYNIFILETNQMHIADRTGDAIVLGLDPSGEPGFTRKNGNFIVSTNFNLLHPKRQCDRYETATTMLENMNELTHDYCRLILKNTAPSYTMYSNINDLKNGLIYLYSHSDFEREAVLDLKEEFSKGLHSYDIESLVTSQTNTPEDTAFISLIFTSLIFGSVVIGCVAIIAFKLRTQLSRRKDNG